MEKRNLKTNFLIGDGLYQVEEVSGQGKVARHIGSWRINRTEEMFQAQSKYIGAEVRLLELPGWHV